MATNGGNPDPPNNGKENGDPTMCPYCEAEVWRLPHHLRNELCEEMP